MWLYPAYVLVLKYTLLSNWFPFLSAAEIMDPSSFSVWLFSGYSSVLYWGETQSGFFLRHTTFQWFCYPWDLNEEHKHQVMAALPCAVPCCANQAFLSFLLKEMGEGLEGIADLLTIGVTRPSTHANSSSFFHSVLFNKHLLNTLLGWALGDTGKSDRAPSWRTSHMALSVRLAGRWPVQSTHLSKVQGVDLLKGGHAKGSREGCPGLWQ